MIILVSPAKSLNFETTIPTSEFSQPVFIDEASGLIQKLRKLSSRQIGKMMGISPSLSELNRDRFAQWNTPFTQDNAKQALFVFTGDVYRGMNVSDFSEEDVKYAQRKLRILSGLYGVLKPLDLMQAYRLEMGSRFAVTKAKNNLYKFWGDKVTEVVNSDLEAESDEFIVNLASAEYFKVFNPKIAKGEIITPHFRDWKNGEYKSIQTYAKLARGMMTSYLIKNKVDSMDELIKFNTDGYAYNDQLSEPMQPVFY